MSRSSTERRSNVVPRDFGVHVSLAERRLLTALRRSRSASIARESVPEAEDVYRGVSNRRYQGPRHFAVLLYDAFLRGAPEAELRAVEMELGALVTSWIRARDGEKPLPLSTAHLAEESAEGMREVAELDFVYDTSPATAVRLCEAIDRHEIASSQLEMCARSYLEQRNLA